MTSKNFFFKVMKEDLRHKIWMLALSALGSFLMLTVVWLIWRSNQADIERLAAERTLFRGMDSREYLIGETVSFFREYVSVTGGIVAIAGAVITGLFGFRFVFHKNMVDTYHSLPVKRDALFASCFLNGFLLWFLPFIAFYLPTLALAAGFLGKLGVGGEHMGRLFGAAALTLATLATVFLLVYGLVLTAVMLSGNILNTLVSMAILGLGGICAVGILYAFFLSYMDRFYDMWNWSALSHVSPLFAAPALLYWRMGAEGGLGSFLGKLAVDFALAAALGCFAWLLYRRRASELAEQGVKNRAAKTLMKILAGIVAGMCGWMLFQLFVGGQMLAWGIFGLTLSALLCLGVLNIIFSMDFKAFFTHKRQTAAVLAVTLLISFAFNWDWMGYDGYLPEKEDIAEAAVYEGSFCNRQIFRSAGDSPLQQMHFQDTDAIYAYLELATAEEPEEAWLSVPTRITRRNGSEYYRRYSIGKEDINVIWPLLSSPEYLMYAFVISDEMRESCESFSLQRLGHMDWFQTRDFTPEDFAGIIEAYNQDVLENPEGTLRSSGKRLASISFDMRNAQAEGISVRIGIYDTMERTVEALRAAGLEEWVEELDPKEVASVTLSMSIYSSYGELDTAAREKIAREYYGVYGSGEGQTDQESAEESAGPYADREVEWRPVLEITDSEEIEELCALMDYEEYTRSDRLFREGYVEITYLDRAGDSHTGYLERGALPEKYVLRFGDCS